MGRRVGILAASALALAVFAAPAAWAYTLEGPKWSGQPSPGSCCASFQYREFAGQTADIAGWNHAASAWNNSIALVNWSLSSSGEEVDARDTDNSSVSWDGLTQWTTYTGSDGKTYFHQPVTATLNYHYTKSYSSNEIQSVSTHELGHAMGLGHASGCVIMNSTTSSRYGSCGVYTPRTDDTNGVNHLY